MTSQHFCHSDAAIFTEQFHPFRRAFAKQIIIIIIDDSDVTNTTMQNDLITVQMLIGSLPDVFVCVI